MKRTITIAARIAVLLFLTVLSNATNADGITAVRATDFPDSISVNSSIDARGESLEKTAACARYTGIRWFRAGIEGDVPVQNLIQLHRDTGVRFSWGLGSGESDITKLLSTAKPLAAAGALLAFEGPNEPNNWGITFQDQAGGRDHSWLPVAKLQSSLYQAVKADPALRSYPVWSLSENGAETDNVGLQFLTIPPEADTLMPAVTRYADAANVHNYLYHPNAPGPADNKMWDGCRSQPCLARGRSFRRVRLNLGASVSRLFPVRVTKPAASHYGDRLRHRWAGDRTNPSAEHFESLS